MNLEFKNNFCTLVGCGSEEFDNLFKMPPFRGIRVNTLKADLKTVQKCFDFNLTQTPFFKNEYYIPSGYSGIGNLPLHHAGAFYVQEPSASSVLSVLDVKPGDKVLDLCAAPGGKSTGIAEALKGNGILWSNEFIKKRAVALLSNIERMGIPNAVVSSMDTEYLCKALVGFFDCVLVDAPCSGEGMWRHNPLVEQEWSIKNIDLCVNRQRQILNSAAKAVRAGGRLVYSTCTFNVRENEENVLWFLGEHKEFVLKNIRVEFGRKGLLGRSDIDDAVRRVLPQDGGEGHFIAVFEKDSNNIGNTEYDTFSENISPNNKIAVESFLKSNFSVLPEGILIEKNNMVSLVPNGLPKIKGDILRCGILLGEIRKGRLEPAHSLFAAIGTKPLRKLDLSINDPLIYSFLRGAEIPAEVSDPGYIAIMVEGCPLGFGKRSANRITNKYPKGLRLK